MLMKRAKNQNMFSKLNKSIQNKKEKKNKNLTGITKRQLNQESTRSQKSSIMKNLNQVKNKVVTFKKKTV